MIIKIKMKKKKKKLNINDAILEKLKLDGGSGNSEGGVVAVSGESDIGGTVDVNMVPSGDPSPHFPLNPTVDLDVDQHAAGGLVLAENLEHEGGDGDGGAVEEGRPDGGVAVALVGGRERGGEGDLLAAVGGVGVEFGVVNADAVVGVEGRERHLHGQCERVRGGGGGGGRVAGGGEVEGVHGGVFQDEAGLGRPEDDPYEEDYEENEEYEP